MKIWKPFENVFQTLFELIKLVLTKAVLVGIHFQGKSAVFYLHEGLVQANNTKKIKESVEL